MTARWTSTQLAQHRGKALDKKAKRQKPPTAKDKQAHAFVQLCRAFNLPEPVAEYRFHPTRRWRIDWYFEANGRKVALEVEGGVWRGGRHTNPAGFVKDMEKYNALSEAGIILLRVTPDRLLKIETVELVKRTLYQ